MFQVTIFAHFIVKFPVTYWFILIRKLDSLSVKEICSYMGNKFRTIFADESLALGVGRLGRYTSTSHTASAMSESEPSTRKRDGEDDYGYSEEDFKTFTATPLPDTPPQDLSTSSKSDVFASHARELK